MASPEPRSRHRYTYEEYLAYERDSGLKHEYEDGEILAMPGDSRRHNALALRIGAALDRGRKTGCIAFQSDQKVRVLATGKATYPDVSLVCGAIEGDPADPSGATITNPNLVLEVLSPSTEEDDRGSKWRHYQLIPSLDEYVLVSQGPPRVEQPAFAVRSLGVSRRDPGHTAAGVRSDARPRLTVRRSAGLKSCALQRAKRVRGRGGTERPI
jgi:Uma2 family endonuclease